MPFHPALLNLAMLNTCQNYIDPVTVGGMAGQWMVVVTESGSPPQITNNHSVIKNYAAEWSALLPSWTIIKNITYTHNTCFSCFPLHFHANSIAVKACYHIKKKLELDSRPPSCTHHEAWLVLLWHFSNTWTKVNWQGILKTMLPTWTLGPVFCAT